MNPFKNTRFFIVVALALQLVVFSCTTIDLYEKTSPIPGHSWKSSFKPSFSFTIKDTSSPYQVYMVLRHTEKYTYTNLYVNLLVKGPGQDTAQTIRQDLTLATNNGWLGTGMDDIYEQRIKMGDPQLLRAGTYTFTVEQLMREDPLPNILDIGLRVEKKQ